MHGGYRRLLPLIMIKGNLFLSYMHVLFKYVIPWHRLELAAIAVPPAEVRSSKTHNCYTTRTFPPRHRRTGRCAGVHFGTFIKSFTCSGSTGTDSLLIFRNRCLRPKSYPGGMSYILNLYILSVRLSGFNIKTTLNYAHKVQVLYALGIIFYISGEVHQICCMLSHLDSIQTVEFLYTKQNIKVDTH